MSEPWICPRCARVWAPYISHCHPCNEKIEDEKPSQRQAIKSSLWLNVMGPKYTTAAVKAGDRT